jgi:hypothetical protein
MNPESRDILFFTFCMVAEEMRTQTTLGRTCQIMDNLISQGKAKPMSVVMTNGNPWQAAAPGEEPIDVERAVRADFAAMGRGLFEGSLAKDVIPFIESHYRVIPERNYRAVSGLSMGGMQAMNFSESGIFSIISWKGLSVSLCDSLYFKTKAVIPCLLNNRLAVLKIVKGFSHNISQ